MSSEPQKRIVSTHNLEQFIASQTYSDLVEFITKLNYSITNVKLTDEIPQSPVVGQLLEILNNVQVIVQETPPVDNGQSRFGNPAFRTFYDTIKAQSHRLHSTITGFPAEMITEVSAYFTESWGNRTRIDYGSGMELNFICWLLCLNKLGVTTEDDNKAIVARVFWKYMTITRILQTTYWLEPAGSHGAQGLDDYHFAVFIFGSAQLATHPHFRPKAIHDKEILDEFAHDYMYFDYVKYINSIKTASLRWHSPMLDDISGVKTWSKINSGMIKMYTAEVLCKLPVAQHFLFGSLLPYPESLNSEEGIQNKGEEETRKIHEDASGHLHVKGEGFGDCCGIPIPSRFAAMEEERKRSFATSGGVRRIPFD